MGTSGFAYAGWRGVFYPPDLPDRSFLSYYATRFHTCELNGTFYARPSPRAVSGWLAATPPDFRFIVKAQRGGAYRAMVATPAESVAWLTDPLAPFGDRLGGVLFRVPREIRRRGPEDDARLRAVLAAWPPAIPLVVELQDPGWHVDETFQALHEAGAVLCATDLDDADAPTIRLTGPAVYLRLRRSEYTDADLVAWAERITPFVADGRDAWVYFRHDDTGVSTRNALRLEDVVRARLRDRA